MTVNLGFSYCYFAVYIFDPNPRHRDLTDPRYLPQRHITCPQITNLNTWNAKRDTLEKRKMLAACWPSNLYHCICFHSFQKIANASNDANIGGKIGSLSFKETGPRRGAFAMLFSMHWPRYHCRKHTGGQALPCLNLISPSRKLIWIWIGGSILLVFHFFLSFIPTPCWLSLNNSKRLCFFFIWVFSKFPTDMSYNSILSLWRARKWTHERKTTKTTLSNH